MKFPLLLLTYSLYLIYSSTALKYSKVCGVVQSGGTNSSIPLAGVKVTLFVVADISTVSASSVKSDKSGKFCISIGKWFTEWKSTKVLYYLDADLGRKVNMITVIGHKLTIPFVVVNELTTVAASYSFAQFYKSSSISGDSFGLQIANSMIANVVDISTGIISTVLSTSPNADETNSLRLTNSLSNLLAACLYDNNALLAFFQATDPHASSTAHALASLARNPAKNVNQIYLITKTVVLYSPTLSLIPDCWSVTIKINDSGDKKQLIGAPANLVFDDNGFVWVTCNVVQGTPVSSRILIVFQSNGKPANGKNGSPHSPISGGGLLGAGFGITKTKNSIFVGNFGWGPIKSCAFYPSPECSGSVSEFTFSGKPVSGPSGYQGGPNRAQGMDTDKQGNIWITSYGSDQVFVFLKGNPKKSVVYQLYNGSAPFDVHVNRDGTAWVSSGGGFTGTYPSSLTKLQLVGNKLMQLKFIRFGNPSIESIDSTQFGKANKGFSIDSLGNVWVPSQAENSIYGFDSEGNLIGNYTGGGINGPWDVEVDGDDNLWVANFGPLSVPELFSGRLSKLAGANPLTIPKGLKTGDPISPSTGYTVPSAGSQVLLNNGSPLYGPNAPAAYSPMQRSTSCKIDAAGNVWSVNNWKDLLIVDVTVNPGGDGIIIFLGLAAPVNNKKNNKNLYEKN